MKTVKFGKVYVGLLSNLCYYNLDWESIMRDVDGNRVNLVTDLSCESRALLVNKIKQKHSLKLNFFRFLQTKKLDFLSYYVQAFIILIA